MQFSYGDIITNLFLNMFQYVFSDKFYYLLDANKSLMN